MLLVPRCTYAHFSYALAATLLSLATIGSAEESSRAPAIALVLPEPSDFFGTDIPSPEQFWGEDMCAFVKQLMLAEQAQPATGKITIDYPFEDSLFPPDICAPTFLWHDSIPETKFWLINISFAKNSSQIWVFTGAKKRDLVIDDKVVSDQHLQYYDTEYFHTVKEWIPNKDLWEEIKHRSVGVDAQVSIMGLAVAEGTSAPPSIRSFGRVSFQTSIDPVGAPIFYRDVPLKPDKGKKGVIAPLSEKLYRQVLWRLRDISSPDSRVVMKDVSTCINCHSFSLDGATMGADMDGPRGDKGSYFLAPISKKMNVEYSDVFTWNDYPELPPGKTTIGFFAKVSPDGRYVVTMVSDELFVANYMDFRFLQTFYPVRGNMGYYNTATKEIKRLPGADNPDYVQSNPFWTPDGKNIIFIRAKAVPRYGSGPMPTFANAPEETFIQYDLYRIPFADGNGGEAVPIVGASNNGKSNSMPAISPDGKWLVYVQCYRGLLMRPDSKLFIIPAEGGEAREMRCNLPLMNSWHSWSPNSKWVVFASKGLRHFTQMFLTHVNEFGEDTPPILIPNSTADNRAVNIPEFINIPPDGLEDIFVPAAEYRKQLDAAMDLRRQKKFEEAMTQLELALAARPDYPISHVEKGWLLHEMGKSQDAIPCFMDALKLDPRSTNALNNWGMVLLDTGQLEQAVDKFRECLAIRRKNPEAENNLGLALKELGKLDEAIEHFQRCNDIDPQDYAFSNIADTLLRQRKPLEAIDYCQKALDLNPNSSDAERIWGDALFLQMNQPKEAKIHYQNAIKFDSTRKEAFLGLGIMLTNESQNEEALVYLNKARELSPNYPETYNRIGNALLNLGKYDEALREYEKADKLRPNDMFVHHNMGIALASLNRYPEAIEHYKKSLAINPNYSSAHNYLGNAYAALGRLDEAIDAYKKAIQTDPGNCYAKDNLGLSEAKRGNIDAARAMFEQALRCAEETGNSPLATEIRNKLAVQPPRP